MGFILGLLVSVPVVLSAFNGTLDFSSLLFLVIYSMFGFIFPRIIGESLVTIQFASVVSAVVSIAKIEGTAIVASVSIFALTFAAQHLIAYLRPAASASVGASTPLRKGNSSKPAKGQDVSTRDKYRQNWIEYVMDAPFDYGDNADCEQMWILWGHELESLGIGENLDYANRKNLYKLRDFAHSNVLKLHSLMNPEHHSFTVFPMPEDRNTPQYFSSKNAFALDFEEILIDVNSIYESGLFKRPERFEEMVTKTRSYLNSSRGKAIFSK
jgi:hypothetical protein